MSKRKLLLADDSATIQKVVKLTFADEGIEVSVAADGHSALEKIAENTPDLVLADVNLPDIGGYQICETIKRNEKTKRVPVILLVGSFEPFDEDEARRVGADDYMTKPFQSIRQLVTKVSGLLNNDAGETENSAAVKTAENSSVETAENPPQTISAEADGDAQIDAEAIETAQIGSSLADEAERFSAASPDEDASQAAVNQTAETSDYSAGGGEYLPDGEKIYDFAGEEAVREIEPVDYTISEPDDSAAETSLKNESSSPKNPFADFDLDEINLLELFDEGELYGFEVETVAPVIINDAGRTASRDSGGGQSLYAARNFQSEFQAEIANGQMNGAAAAAQNQSSLENLSPASIEAIAAKVAEKLSDRVIREIAAEIVPQMADSILREMARDRFDG